MSVASPAHSQPFIDDEDDESHNCRRCDLPISEGHAYELGGDRWHMYCFSCSKCSKLLGTSSNFLVLGTGDLICSDCSYACNACGKKIDDLAILTGDQAYCSTCFCCRSCKKRIEDLRYARTSKGLFCMACHEKLLEKKKRHEQEKQDKKSRLSQRNSRFTNFEKSLPRIPDSRDPVPNRVTTPDSMSSGLSTPGVLETTARAQTGTPSLTPAIPPRSPNRKNVTPITNSISKLENTLEPALIVSPTMETITPQFHTGYKFDSNSITSSLYEDTKEITSEFAVSINQGFAEPEDYGDPTSATSGPDDYLHAKTPTRDLPISPLRSNLLRSPNGDLNRQAVVVDSVSSGDSSNILSSYINSESPPPKIPPPKVPATEDAKLSDSRDQLKYNDKNEADDFIDLNDSDEDEKKSINHSLKHNFNEVLDKYKDEGNGNENNDYEDKQGQHRQEEDEEERSKYKETPDGFGQVRNSENIPSGLNIQGLEANEPFHNASQGVLNTPFFDVPKTSPWKLSSNTSQTQKNGLLSPTSPSPSHAKKNALLNITNETSLTRNRSIRSPKAFLNNFTRKHKKSESNSSIEYKISSPFLTTENIQYNQNGVSTPSANPRKSIDIVTSPYQGAALFTTPPVPDNHHHRQESNSSIQANFYHHQYSNSQHQRSTSSGNYHVRSISDAATNSYAIQRRSSISSNVVNEANENKFELELRALKTEIRDLKQARHSINQDIAELTERKQKLTHEVQNLSSKLNILKIEDSNRSIKASSTPIPDHQNSKSVDLNEHAKIDKNTIGLPILTSELSNSAFEPIATDTKQQKSRGKFWKRGNFFNKTDSSGISGSQSSYSLSNILNDANGSTKGNPAISAPSLKTAELDELGGNDNKKLLASNANQPSFKYLDINSGQTGSSSSSSSQNNSSSSNGSPGVIMSDLFNSTLESRAIFEKRPIPLIITRLVEEVEKRGLDHEGIYRKNGGTSQMNSILKAFNNLYQSETSQELEKVLEGDIAALTSSLKRYLYHILPEPIISSAVYEEFINIPKLSNNEEKIEKLKQLLAHLPQTNTITLRFLLSHIKRIEASKDKNKMTYHNLAVVFGPTFTRVSSGERELMDMKPRNESIEFMISHSDAIF